MSNSEGTLSVDRPRYDAMRKETYVDGIQDTLQGLLEDIKGHPDASHPEYISGVTLVEGMIAARVKLADDKRKALKV